MARAATDSDAEQAIELIGNEGRTIRKCSIELGCDYPSLSRLLLTDQYSARAREARLLGAEMQLDNAHDALLAIPDEATRAMVARQTALEQHYRKRASFLDPRRYGDKMAIGGADDLPPLKTASDEELDAKIAALMAKQSAI